MSSRRIVLLTDGLLETAAAKTAHSLIRFCPEDVVAVLDPSCAGKTAEEVLGFGGKIPIVESLSAVKGANQLAIGIAPPGGKLPEAWRPILLSAIERGMDVVSGLHDLLRDDADLVAAAKKHGRKLIDVRDNDEGDCATFEGLDEGCLRIHTVANDCSCGKMTATLEMRDELVRRGVGAKFLATGQTGIMIEGDGLPIDRVIADFVSGAAEKLVLANQHHDVLLIEGQGSLFHPRYSGVTLGLLHGVRPDGLVLCYEMGRTAVFGMSDWLLPSLDEVVDFYERAAGVMHPAKVIGVAVSAPGRTDEEVEAEIARVEEALGLPACDVYRHGAAKLVDATLALGRSLGKRAG